MTSSVVARGSRAMIGRRRCRYVFSFFVFFPSVVSCDTRQRQAKDAAMPRRKSSSSHLLVPFNHLDAEMIPFCSPSLRGKYHARPRGAHVGAFLPSLPRSIPVASCKAVRPDAHDALAKIVCGIFPSNCSPEKSPNEGSAGSRDGTNSDYLSV